MVTIQSQNVSGPLFIIGRPRSGTKLLRTLLNGHPKIAIPISETNFFPNMMEAFGNKMSCRLARMASSWGQTIFRYSSNRCSTSPNNKRKYSLLGRSVIKRIEEIVFPTAVAFGYELEYATSVRPLSSFRRRLFQIHDGLAMTSFYMKDKGISWGAKYLWQGVLRKGGIQKVSDHMRRPPRVNHYE